jgi:hypothetical protein
MMSLEVGRLDVAVSGASGERVAVGGWRNLITGGGRVIGVGQIIGGHGLTYQAAPLERWAPPDEPGAGSLGLVSLTSLSDLRAALELSAA